MDKLIEEPLLGWSFLKIPTLKKGHQKKLYITCEDKNGERIVFLLCECKLKFLEQMAKEFKNFVEKDKVPEIERKIHKTERYIG